MQLIFSYDVKILPSGMDQSKHAVNVFDRRAADYAARYMDVSLYHDTLNAFCDALKPNAKILEVACGPGNITRYLRDRRDDLQITGTDLSPNMVALAKQNNPDAEFFLLDMRDIGQLAGFDAVLCGFGLPYLSKDDAIAFIGQFPRVLKPDGWVYLSTMEGRYDQSKLQKSSDGKDEIFIHLHEAEYLVTALESAGFSIIDQRRQHFPDGQNTIDLILIAKWTQK
jgi:ubiquinone/menaquinone biosynthesis C-methylase UbiE